VVIGLGGQSPGHGEPLNGEKVLLSLELDRHLASMRLDPELLYRAELAQLGGQT
jgi:hypothetical protein